jgi:hypothetical protein
VPFADAGEQPLVLDGARRALALDALEYADADTPRTRQMDSTPKRPRYSSM